MKLTLESIQNYHWMWPERKSRPVDKCRYCLETIEPNEAELCDECKELS